MNSKQKSTTMNIEDKVRDHLAADLNFIEDGLTLIQTEFKLPSENTKSQ